MTTVARNPDQGKCLSLLLKTAHQCDRIWQSDEYIVCHVVQYVLISSHHSSLLLYITFLLLGFQ